MQKFLKLRATILIFALCSPFFVQAADLGNTSDYAWAEKFGYVKMNGGTVDYGVTVADASLSGYAWSEKTGWINFNDAGALYAVTNDGSGNLSGHAWSEKLGYISFDDSSANNYYQVTIDSSGNFSGYAWSEKGGYINMDDAGELYKVTTTWSAVGISAITLSPATKVEKINSTLNGNVTDTGGEDPTVTIYWGKTDEGQTPASWDNSSVLGSQGVAPFSKSVTNLNQKTKYYFKAKATNAAGTGWTATSSFTTEPLAPPIMSPSGGGFLVF